MPGVPSRTVRVLGGSIRHGVSSAVKMATRSDVATAEQTSGYPKPAYWVHIRSWTAPRRLH